MAYLYYPGCTLKTKAKALDQYAIQSMEALGVDFIEKDDWQCCGAVYPMARDEIAPRLSAVRTLADAGEENRALLTLCSACHHVMKRVNHDMQTDENIRQKVNNYSQFKTPYAGETAVIHFLEMLRDHVGFDNLKTRVTNPLTGRKIGAYYGCLLLRPSGVMAFDNPENPSIMEDFIRAIGADPVIYSYRNECCGSYAAIESREQVQSCCQKVLASATDKGADALITACPLCLHNLEAYSDGLPVYYFTQLLAQALGVQDEK